MCSCVNRRLVRMTRNASARTWWRGQVWTRGQAFRLLGSRFFNEFQTSRSSQKNKVDDVNVSETLDSHEASNTAETGHYEKAFLMLMNMKLIWIRNLLMQ